MTLERAIKFDPHLIATTCSPRHIQSVLEDHKAELIALHNFVNKIAALNPNAGEIGAGMLANIVQTARLIQAGKFY